MENILAKGAMLACVEIINGGLLGERKDVQATEHVEHTFGVTHKRAKTSKYLIDRDHKTVKAIVAKSQRVREVLYKYANPWEPPKWLLVADLEPICRLKMDAEVVELKQAWQDYVDVYPQLVADSERELGSLFDRSQYPPQSEIMKMFSVNIRYWPVPQSNHFLAQISEASAKEAKEAIEREIENRLIEASADMVSRATEVVTTFVDRLEGFKKKDEASGAKSFRDSLVKNIAETAGLIDAMNITKNPQIDKVVQSLQRLSKYSAFSLRKDDDTRGKAITDGQQILANLAMLDLRDKEVADMVAGASDFMD